MTAALRQGERYPNVHAVLIAKSGQLVYESYFTGEDKRWNGERFETVTVEFDRTTLHDSRSVGKSITSAVVGIALDRQAIPSLDTPLLDYFPELDSLATPEKRAITVRHALMMSAGLRWNEFEVPYTDPSNDAERTTAHDDPAAYVFSRSMASTPGTQWYYNSGLPAMLGIAVARATNKAFGAYARELLFEPLGIRDVEWASYSNWDSVPELAWESDRPWATNSDPGGNVWMTARDFAKFGSLYLSGGRWNGEQILTESWVSESTRRRLAVTGREKEIGEFGYGYLWWHDLYGTDSAELEVHTAAGNGGQRIYVIPALDLLVVILCGGYNDPDFFWMPEQILLDEIIPAVRIPGIR